MFGGYLGRPESKTIFVWRALYCAYRPCLVEVVDERDRPKWEINPWRLCLSELDFEIKYKKGRANSQSEALSRLLTKGETVDAIDDEIQCFMVEPAGATKDEEEDFERLDDILALEGGPPLIASINSKLSLQRS